MRKFVVRTPKGKLVGWGTAKAVAKAMPKILAKAPHVSVAPVVHKIVRRKPQPITMYDSVNVGQIPADAAAVAGYVNGHWPTFSTLVRTHPNAKRVSIAVSVFADAQVLDVERGDATPDEAPGWVKLQKQRGEKRPGVYAAVSEAQTVIDELARHGIKRDQYRLWTAHYTDVPHLCTPKCGNGFRDRADATQYTDKALGRNLDASLCSPGFFE